MISYSVARPSVLNVTGVTRNWVTAPWSWASASPALRTMVKRRRVTSSSVIALVRNCSSCARVVLFSSGATYTARMSGGSDDARPTSA